MAAFVRADLESVLGQPSGLACAEAPGQNGSEETITEIKVIGLRRLIAERMSEAKRNIPHFAYRRGESTSRSSRHCGVQSQHGASCPRDAR